MALEAALVLLTPEEGMSRQVLAGRRAQSASTHARARRGGACVGRTSPPSRRSASRGRHGRGPSFCEPPSSLIRCKCTADSSTVVDETSSPSTRHVAPSEVRVDDSVKVAMTCSGPLSLATAAY